MTNLSSTEEYHLKLLRKGQEIPVQPFVRQAWTTTTYCPICYTSSTYVFIKSRVTKEK